MNGYNPRHHTCCAWCGRLKHRGTGQPHGPRFNARALANIGYSHGACAECKAQLIRRG